MFDNPPPAQASASNTSARVWTPANSIDEVLAQLDDIISDAIDQRDKLGYFAALYRTVTAAVKAAIAEGRFEDGPRMDRLDVAFANRYLDALDRYRRGAPTPRSWQAAFDAATHRRVVIMQHLLLGMNAHINLDLGISAADVCPGASLAGLERDFNEINVILDAHEADIERELCSLSPWIDKLAHIDPTAGRVISNFSIVRARQCAWESAQRLSVLTGAERDAAIARIDDDVTLLARLVERPIGFIINVNLVLVRLRESWNVRRTIRVLSGTATNG